MGNCFICKKETDNLASVYVGNYEASSIGNISKINYEKASQPLCTDCISKHTAHDFSGVWFFIGMQLLWFKVAGDGIFSVLGAFCAIVAAVSLFRLAVLLIRRYYQRCKPGRKIPKIFYRREDISEQASVMLKAKVKDYYTSRGMRILTETEYKRSHKT
ncbi:hypothetical protein LY28_03065 [Ruminiclostridium sufflavum DSM 19573]|uniref:Uncharacterized protein n=1 Tax=Ruminiclostridium sufflavum DSM 19573 TaxID=1121337 RepID=A0A318XJ01_9FIRM|nr:hypothetical protein [Ruminiclostridium sufflavum]PYG85911.1 hypothetical protein LY28_03065 [Ruminiclostridium sufflavum DSM 19573]